MANGWKEAGASITNLLGGAARGFGWEGTALQSLQTICRWLGISEDDKLWKFGNEIEIAKAITERLRNSKARITQVSSKIQKVLDNLPPILSQNMNSALRDVIGKAQNDMSKLNSLQSQAEQYENLALASGQTQTQKLVGTRIHDHSNEAFDLTNKAKENYDKIYELGKDY